MAKIASLAQQHKLALEKENLYFDINAVNEVERTLRGIPSPYPTFSTDFDEEALDLLRDRYHCTEAWRNALLIYIERVFRWTRANQHLQTRNTLLAVSWSMPEIRREEDREFVRDYCSWWTSLCGSKMFIDASDFCEEIWERADKEGSQEIWWGGIIDMRCSESKLPVRPQILLG
ncbi:hypothetical protein N7509_007396 [Penicillium cosmopolitanum]|uniref:Uncharacterized protein n=1 Tax=Penicillium cosmopolitanum TaxID=1131564 RepID=A0A9W9VZ16_9EURO|nr:uncharacterized protein N7509_007396 [Penicillium cosmopolitanum]KAJ5391906.1 hypothetical protein N7509_007396 [Penicillium cosmopolitanum]